MAGLFPPSLINVATLKEPFRIRLYFAPAARFFCGAGLESVALIRSFMMLLALKTITRRGVIGTISPVFGFRPMRSDFCRSPKEPKDESFVDSPRSRA